MDPHSMEVRPIGVFDSGLGGLTVLRALIDLLPHEPTLYFGDTGRFPYGSKPHDEVLKYAIEISDLLVDREVQMLVVACNSATSVALDALRARYPIPVIGVVEPGVRAASLATRSGRVGVIGTVGTIASGAYQRAAAEYNLRLTCAACPGFVEFVESGDVESDQVHVLAERLLAPLKEASIDTLILGCTHYPLLARTIADVMGRDVVLVSSADETAFEVRRVLVGTTPLTPPGPAARRAFMTSGDVHTFHRLGARFLGPEVAAVEAWQWELTVLGCSGSFGAPPMGACSGYLVREGDTNLWLDCGNGTFSTLQEHLDPADLSAVVITHSHPDHSVDFFGLHVCLHYGLGVCDLPVYVPPGLEKLMSGFVHEWGETFEWHEIVEDASVTIGDLSLRFARTDHPPPTFAVEVSGGGRRLVYSADTGPNWSVGAFGPNADLVISEASYLHDDRHSPIHLSARQAGTAAREAGAKRLMLTHLWPTVDREKSEAEGTDAFGAPVEMAVPNLTTEV